MNLRQAKEHIIFIFSNSNIVGSLSKCREVIECIESLKCCSNCDLDDIKSYEGYPEQYCNKYHLCKYADGAEDHWVQKEVK